MYLLLRGEFFHSILTQSCLYGTYKCMFQPNSFFLFVLPSPVSSHICWTTLQAGEIIRPSGSRYSRFSSRICLRKREKGMRRLPITNSDVQFETSQTSSSQLCSMRISSRQIQRIPYITGKVKGLLQHLPMIVDPFDNCLFRSFGG